MRWIILGAALAISGCSKGPDAEKQYHIVAATGDAQATCNEANKTAQAYLEDKNQSEYRKWRQTADGDCAVARLLSERR